MQVNAVSLPKQEGKGQSRERAQSTPPKEPQKPSWGGPTNQPGKGTDKGRRVRMKRGTSSALHSVEATARKVTIVTMSIKSTLMASLSPWVKSSCRDVIKLSRDRWKPNTQNKAKVVPRGGIGVSSAMLILDRDIDVSQISRAAVQVSEDCYAVVDSGTNAVIVPLRPNMCGDTGVCKVPALWTWTDRPNSELRDRLPQSVILISQEWLTTIAKWQIIAQLRVGRSFCFKVPEHSSTTCYEEQSSRPHKGGVLGSYGRHCSDALYLS